MTVENKKQVKKEDNFLLYIPMKKHKEWEVRGGNVYLIFHHNKLPEKILRIFSKKRPKVTDIKLDNLGTAVWNNCNGENTVYDIGKKLLELPEVKKQYKDLTYEAYEDKCHPIYERLIMYLRYLTKKGWVSFKLSEEVLEEKKKK